MALTATQRLTIDEFLTWAAGQPREAGKLELLDGVVIVQQSQTWGHSKHKLRMFRQLEAAIARAGVPFYAALEGQLVRIGPDKGFEPDVLVAPLPEPADDSVEIANPTIVIEVMSPSTARIDATTKLKGYFELASVLHYLLVDHEGRMITQHRRSSTGAIETQVVDHGMLHLDPPGLDIDLAQIFDPLPTDN